MPRLSAYNYQRVFLNIILCFANNNIPLFYTGILTITHYCEMLYWCNTFAVVALCYCSIAIVLLLLLQWITPPRIDELQAHYNDVYNRHN